MMSDKTPMFYQIRVEGHLDASWADWFDGLRMVYRDDGTMDLVGPVADQAALHGLLVKLRDLRLPLVSLQRTKSAAK